MFSVESSLTDKRFIYCCAFKWRCLKRLSNYHICKTSFNIVYYQVNFLITATAKIFFIKSLMIKVIYSAILIKLF